MLQADRRLKATALFPVQGLRKAAAAAAGCAGIALLSLLIGRVSLFAPLHASLLQFALLLAAVLGAVMVHRVKPAWLVPYIVAAWAFGPEARRLVDWSFQSYSYLPPLALMPLCVTAVLLLTIVPNARKLDPRLRKLALLFACVMAYGLLLGLARSGLSAVYELLSYAAPMLVLLYANVCGLDGGVRDLWLRAVAAIAVLVSAYGIVQYFVVPPWDALWMAGSEMISIGRPVPMEVRVFSTMNAPGVTGVFLAVALGVMASGRKWRAFGVPGMLIVAFCLLLTLVRSGWLALVVMIAVYFFRAGARNRVRLLFALGVLYAAYQFAVPLLPGADTIQSRMGTLGAIEEDHSYNERMAFVHKLVPAILANPVGNGLGSSGLANKLGGGGGLSFDNGYLNLIYTFGVAGGLALLAVAMAAAAPLMRIRGAGRGYASLSVAMAAAALFLLFGQNVFTGAYGLLFWLLVSLGYFREPEGRAAPTT